MHRRGSGLLALWLLAGCGVVPASAGAYGGTPVQPPAAAGRSQASLSAAQACDNLCTLTQLHCKNENRAYPSFSACMEFCAGIQELGQPGDTHGDSIQCRFSFALLAKHTLTMWFCQNASASGGLQCH